jgi:hypothetical protein
MNTGVTAILHTRVENIGLKRRVQEKAEVTRKRLDETTREFRTARHIPIALIGPKSLTMTP